MINHRDITLSVAWHHLHVHERVTWYVARSHSLSQELALTRHVEGYHCYRIGIIRQTVTGVQRAEVWEIDVSVVGKYLRLAAFSSMFPTGLVSHSPNFNPIWTVLTRSISFSNPEHERIRVSAPRIGPLFQTRLSDGVCEQRS